MFFRLPNVRILNSNECCRSAFVLLCQVVLDVQKFWEKTRLVLELSIVEAGCLKVFEIKCTLKGFHTGPDALQRRVLNTTKRNRN